MGEEHRPAYPLGDAIPQAVLHRQAAAMRRFDTGGTDSARCSPARSGAGAWAGAIGRIDAGTSCSNSLDEVATSSYFALHAICRHQDIEQSCQRIRAPGSLRRDHTGHGPGSDRRRNRPATTDAKPTARRCAACRCGAQWLATPSCPAHRHRAGNTAACWPAQRNPPRTG